MRNTKGIVAAVMLWALVVPSASAQLSRDRYIPHIAQGFGWTTEIHVFNVCPSPGQYRVFFFASSGGTFLFGKRGGEPRRETYIEGQPINEETHVWVFPDTETELVQGYGQISDDSGDGADGGCIVADVIYKQHLPNGEIRSATVPLQRLSERGSVLRFDNTGGCRTGVAVIATTDVRVDARDSTGGSVVQLRLGEIDHASFVLDERLPTLQGLDGTLHISGDVGLLGLEFCEGKLTQFLLPHPVPSLDSPIGTQLWSKTSFDQRRNIGWTCSATNGPLRIGFREDWKREGQSPRVNLEMQHIVDQLPEFVDGENDTRITNQSVNFSIGVRRFDYRFDVRYDPSDLPIEDSVLMSVFEQRQSPDYHRLVITATEAFHVENTPSRVLRAAIEDGGIISLGFYRSGPTLS